MPPQKSGSVLAHLEALFQEVVRAVKSRKVDRQEETRFNAKGDRVKWFDLAADDAVCAYLDSHFPSPVRLLSEEGEPREFGSGKPDFTLVLDPVDGSDNFALGIGPCGTAAALIPADHPISVRTVQFALVGDLCTGTSWIAARGGGAHKNKTPLRTSPVQCIENAMVSCELNHFRVEAQLAALLRRTRGVRTFGCAAWALSNLAAGVLDAHLDLRARLTPENFLAPSLIIGEAGGMLTDPGGKPLPEIQSLTERYSILAAATPELHSALVESLKER